MTASCLSPSCLAPARLRTARSHRRGCAGGLLAVAALLLLAALLAPEQPLSQASICERHNGVAACRVW